MRILLLMLLATAFAGCTQELPTDETSMPADGFAPQTGHDEATTDDLSLVGDLMVGDCDAAYCIEAVATNEGSTTYHIDAICTTPWSEAMKHRDSEVQKSEPTATCLAFGTKPLGPGAQANATFTWDGRLWDDDAREYRDAPQGEYTWSVAFRAYTEADGGEAVSLTISFPVVVGAT